MRFRASCAGNILVWVGTIRDRYLSSRWKPFLFPGVGGAKIFRDAIWGRLRFPFRADFVACKRFGAFDFPQNDWKTRIQNGLMSLLSKSPGEADAGS